MRIFRRLAGALYAVVRRKRVDAELDEELAPYLAAATEQKIAAGLSPEEAQRIARAGLGSPAAVSDWVRDAGWESRVESIWQDVRYALRILRHSPGFAVVAILMLALGIGANLAVFSVIDAALLKPLPFREADRLVEIFEVVRPGTADETTYSGMHRDRAQRWRTQTRIFDGVELENGPKPMALGDTGTSIGVAQVSAGTFSLLGLSPAIGRHFAAEESASGDQRVLLISDGLWKRAFGATPDIVGRHIVLVQRPVTIIGVMPPEARFPIGRSVDAWQPLTTVLDPKDRTSQIVRVIARLRDGLTPATAQPELAAAAQAMQLALPDREPWTAKVDTIDPRQWKRGTVPIVLIAFGAVAIVLLTACANIASLLLARTSARHREMAIRGAIGASRARLLRQLIVESLVLAIAGGAGAIALAAWLIPAIPGWLPPRFLSFSVHDAQLDWRVLAAAVVASATAGALSGILPAVRGSRGAVAAALAAGRGVTHAPTQRRTRNLLVATQVAFACVLLVGAGLMTSSFVRMMTSDPGYRLDGLLQVSLELPETKSLTNPRFIAVAMSSFAILALLTAAIGLYGMLAYAVSRRTSEIGVRMALGANRSNVRRLIVRDALWPVAIGLILGLAAAQALSRVISAQMYQTKPYDPLTLAAVVAIFAAVAMTAAYLPARRATRVDPVVALRAE